MALGILLCRSFLLLINPIPEHIGISFIFYCLCWLVIPCDAASSLALPTRGSNNLGRTSTSQVRSEMLIIGERSDLVQVAVICRCAIR